MAIAGASEMISALVNNVFVSGTLPCWLLWRLAIEKMIIARLTSEATDGMVKVAPIEPALLVVVSPMSATTMAITSSATAPVNKYALASSRADLAATGIGGFGVADCLRSWRSLHFLITK